MEISIITFAENPVAGNREPESNFTVRGSTYHIYRAIMRAGV